MLKLKRAYEPGLRSDGTRVLVERLWPRGLSTATLRVDASRDTQHNNAVALKNYLQTKIRRQLRSR
jgi:uncharacterized protein YeaO (DUF488 family)